MLSLFFFPKKETTFITQDGLFPCDGKTCDHFLEESEISQDHNNRVKNIAATLGAFISSGIAFSIIYLSINCFIKIEGLDNKRVHLFGEDRSFHELNKFMSISMSFFGFCIGWRTAKIRIEELDNAYLLQERRAKKLS